MNPDSFRFDPGLYHRVNAELEKGKFDIEHFPIGGIK